MVTVNLRFVGKYRSLYIRIFPYMHVLFAPSAAVKGPTGFQGQGRRCVIFMWWTPVVEREPCKYEKEGIDAEESSALLWYHLART